MTDYIQFINIEQLPDLVRKEILALNRKYTTKKEWGHNIVVYSEQGFEIDVDVQDKDYPRTQVINDIKEILNKNNIKYILSSAG